MAQLVHSITTSDVGQKELDRILYEAEKSGEGRGSTLKDIWDDDVRSFDEDQLDNGI